MFRTIILLAAAAVLLPAVSLQAEDAVLGQLYGSGVHAYYSNEYVKAHKAVDIQVEHANVDVHLGPRAKLHRVGGKGHVGLQAQARVVARA